MSMRIAGVVAVVLAVPLVLFAQAGGAQQGAPAGRGGARRGGAGRGAAAPANYPPYARPVTTYVPPRTPDGQPDISGLYVGIPLPRGIETPLVPLANRGANRANSEYSFNLNE